MLKVDYHLHSALSVDGDDRLDAICGRAVEVGLSQVCFTEHIDFDTDDPGYGFYDDAAFSRALAAARKRFKDVLSIAKGCEFDFSTTYNADYAGFLEPLEFDFVLGAVHNIFGHHFGSPELLEYSPHKLYEAYFRETRALVETGLCHALAHFDYLYKEYCNDWQSDPRDQWYWKEVEDVLRLCIEKNVGLEVNTHHIEPGITEPAAQPEILARYCALGGRIVTVGSDAHRVGDVGWGLDVAEAHLKDAGFTEIAVFEKRKPVFHPL